jgi:hypothetical protein
MRPIIHQAKLQLAAAASCQQATRAAAAEVAAVSLEQQAAAGNPAEPMLPRGAAALTLLRALQRWLLQLLQMMMMTITAQSGVHLHSMLRRHSSSSIMCGQQQMCCGTPQAAGSNCPTAWCKGFAGRRQKQHPHQLLLLSGGPVMAAAAAHLHLT